VSRFVLDASAAVAAVLGQKRAEPLLESLESATSLVAPDIFASEVANSCWKYVSHGELSSGAALLALEEATSLVDEFVPTSTFAAEALTEAIRLSHPVYDLCYAVTARRSAATVITLDARLARLLDRLGVRHIP
jgi:predicted nucleic acid-binding protein